MCEVAPFEALSSSVSFATASKLLITAGIFNVLLSFLGFWAASNVNPGLFILFFLFLLSILGLVISAAAVGYENRDKVRGTLSDDVFHVIRKSYGIKTEPSGSMRDLQLLGYCCGWYNYTDWRQSRFTRRNDSIVPDSCCKDERERYVHSYRCGENFTLESIYTRGCQDVFLLDLVREKLYIVANTAIIAAVTQALGALFVLLLPFKLKHLGEQIPLCSRTPRI